MKTFLVSLVVSATMLLLVADFLPESALRLGFVGNAEAIIGMPWTPLSFAGVARRSMYREAAYGAAAANAAAMNAAAANAAYANAAASQAAAANAAAAQAAAENAAAAQAAAANAAAAQRAPGAAVPIGTVVPSLPSGCNSIVIGGVNYFNCAGVYYRAGFQGNNVVYIVSAP